MDSQGLEIDVDYTDEELNLLLKEAERFRNKDSKVSKNDQDYC